MSIIQLNDSDNESCGMIATTINEDLIQKEWKKFYADTDEVCVNLFVGILNQKYSPEITTRFFIDAIVYV